MSRSRAVLVFGLLVLGGFLAVATALAYRVIIERWGGDPRGTLIAAAAVGISFFISMNLLLVWDERRRRRLKRGEDGSATPRADGPQ
jgi:hypothetical protein